MRLPQFLVVGAMKAGTTAFYQYLLQHPQIYLSADKKESRFLTGLTPETDPEICHYIPVVTGLIEYQTLFEQARPEQTIGEVDPWCLYLYQRTIPRIKKYLSPSTKIVITLRDPVDRCYSNYYQFVRQGWPTNNFNQLVMDFEKNNAKRWYEKMCMEIGLYYEPVKAYLDAFGTENVLVLLHDDFKADPIEILRKICRHIEIDDTFPFDTSYRANQGGVPRSKFIHKFLTQKTIFTNLLKPFISLSFRRKWKYRLINQNIQKYPPITPEIRTRLIHYYKSDVINLQELLQLDLSRWLQ